MCVSRFSVGVCVCVLKRAHVSVCATALTKVRIKNMFGVLRSLVNHTQHQDPEVSLKMFTIGI